MKRKTLLAAALLIATSAPVSAQSVSAGIEAWQHSDYSKAVAIWSPLAEKGDADAQFNLGQAYRLGRGVPTNLATAKSWFERAANQDHVDAQTTLGLLLFQSGDQSGGLKWLKKAADKGEPRAMLMYGTALVNGDGVTQNPILGYAYVSQSAERGLPQARDTLAQLDQIIPAADRNRGKTIAQQLARATPVPKPRPAEVAPKPVEAAAAKPQPQKVVATKPPPKAEPKPKPAASEEVTSSEPAKKEPPKTETAKKEPAKASAEAPAPSGAWRIQLGAFSQRRNAEALYKKVSGRSALSGRTPFYVNVGPVTRLQVGPYSSQASAQSACNAVGISCFPVKAK